MPKTTKATTKAKEAKAAGKEKFYVTTPIYYLNDRPHVGHAYTTVAADILVRWHRLIGEDVLFLTGTDEHGKKIADAAKKKGMPVEEFRLSLIPEFTGAWDLLNIKYDRFIRTTDSDHVKNVQALLKVVQEKGDIYKGTYKGKYCVACENYYLEKDLIDGQICPVHKKPVETIEEETYLFKLSKYQKPLLKYYADHPDFILPSERAKETISRVTEGLRDLSISRKDPKLGVLFPGDKNHSVYVWFDALPNYLTGSKYYVGKSKGKHWPADVHLIGKEILWFHTVIWPAMLMSAGIPLPKTIYAHGWWTVGGEKMSKTVGNVVSVPDLVKHGSDAARYFLFRQASFGEDGDYSEHALVERTNKELGNDLGNLVMRVAVLLEKYNGGKVPHRGKDTKRDKQLIRVTESAYGAANKEIHGFALHRALEEVWKPIREANSYVTDTKLWELDASNKKDKERADAVLYNLVESLRFIDLLITPFIPDAAEKIRRQFGFKDKAFGSLKWGNANKGPGKGGVKKEEPLFPRIEETAGSEDPFSALDLRVAQIKTVAPHPDADKLYVMKIDVGEGSERDLVAGIRQAYSPEELREKKIIVVANMKPAKIRGAESNGMLLAAEGEDGKLGVLTVSKAKPGEKVSAQGIAPKPKKELEYKEFSKLEMKATGKGTVSYKEKELEAGPEKEKVIAERVGKGAKVC